MAMLFFLPFLGGVHLFDWDEINFAELAREMVVSGDYLQLQINFERFTEKPPLFFWLQALSMQLFGIGDYAARLPNAVIGVVVLPFLYISGKFLVDRRFGYFWALSWFGSILPFLYFKSGIIDPIFNLLIFNGLFMLIHYLWRKKDYRDLYFSKNTTTYLVLAGVSIGLAILAKGPVAYLVVFLCLLVYWVLQRFHAYLSLKAFLSFSLIALGVFLLWFAVELLAHGPDFIVEFTIRQWELLTTGDAGHSGFAGYHFVVLLLGCFPASLFALNVLSPKRDLPYHLQNFQLWMLILLWVVLILFSLVGTKIIHYSSLAYYPISFLSALALWRFVNGKTTWKTWNRVLVGIVGGLIFMVSLAFPYLGFHPELLAQLVASDPFAAANIEAAVVWNLWDFVPAIFIGVALLAVVLVHRRNQQRAFHLLFLSTGIWVFLALIFFIGKVEHISQRAHVAFYEERAGEDAYFTTFGFKSYVPWYYGRIQPHNNPNAVNGDWLKYGAVDKPVYISCKLNQHEELEQKISDAVFLYSKNGFYFYKR
jgi:4-amino-4-deoxy-L-arabinose transferase-like glycosyltransferase